MVAIGELLGAEDKKPHDTISEWFKGQPKITQFTIIFFCGAVFSHFAEWKIRDAEPGDVNIENLDVTVNEAKS